MKSDSAAAGQIDSLDEFRTQRRLTDMFRGYDDIESGYGESYARIAARSEQSDISAWQKAVLAMLEANLGSSTLHGFLAVTNRWPPERTVAELVLLGRSVRNIGRHAGSACARTILAKFPGSLRRLPQVADLTVVLSAIERVAEAAPESAQLVAARLDSLLAQVDAAGFDAWASGGLRSCGYDVHKRRNYFGLNDPLSLRPSQPRCQPLRPAGTAADRGAQSAVGLAAPAACAPGFGRNTRAAKGFAGRWPFALSGKLCWRDRAGL